MLYSYIHIHALTSTTRFDGHFINELPTRWPRRYSPAGDKNPARERDRNRDRKHLMRGRIPRITANTTFVCGSVRAPQPQPWSTVSNQNYTRKHGRPREPLPNLNIKPPTPQSTLTHCTQAAIAFWKARSTTFPFRRLLAMAEILRCCGRWVRSGSRSRSLHGFCLCVGRLHNVCTKLWWWCVLSMANVLCSQQPVTASNPIMSRGSYVFLWINGTSSSVVCVRVYVCI